MAVEITWALNPPPLVAEVNGQADVIVEVRWECFASEDGETVRVYGAQEFNGPGAPFVDFNALTKDEVLGWLGEASPEGGLVGTRALIEDAARAKLAKAQAPKPVPKALPNR